MTITQLLILLLIAGICGALGQAIGGYSHGGCLVSIALGFIGALLGTWLARALGSPGAFGDSGGRNALSNYLVDYRSGVVCGADRLNQSPATVKVRGTDFSL